MRNLITDVPGLKVGHAEDLRLGSGSTAVVFDEPAVASIDVRGGGPGTRETALLDPAQTVEGIDAIVLSGGSAFGLDAASGVQAWLKEQGRGFVVRSAQGSDRAGGDPVRSVGRRRQGLGPVPALSRARLCRGRRRPAAILRSAASAPAPAPPRSIARAASARPRRKQPDGFTVGALAAVNAAGSVLVGHGPWFWAAPFEVNGEFGGRGLPREFPTDTLDAATKGSARESTTLVVVATDAILSKAQAKRLAVMAQSGLSRAIYPVHTPLDGDVVFAASTGRRPLADPMLGLTNSARSPPMSWRAPSRAAFLPQPRCLCPARCPAGRINSAAKTQSLRQFPGGACGAETTICIFECGGFGFR